VESEQDVPYDDDSLECGQEESDGSHGADRATKRVRRKTSHPEKILRGCVF